MKTALFVCLAAAGCVEDRPAGQQQFDLTNAQDRALFKPRGMSWKGVAGPYSIYHVTGTQPQLVGPHVVRAGAPSLLTGSQYFGTGKAATVILRSGSHPLIGTTMTPASDGDCIMPQIPGGSSGGEIGGETGSSGGVSGGGGGGGDAPCDLGHNEVTVDIEDAPMNAVVLLGRVSLSGRAAPNYEIFTKICCTGDDCTDPLPPVK